MLKIIVGAADVYDEATDSFGTQGGTPLQLEHSLVSLSKWESKFEKPFLNGEDKTSAEFFEYFRCMLLTEDVPEELFNQLSEENVNQINAYMEAKMTATWFNDADKPPPAREIVTAELIYYWMTIFNISWEAQYWHLNRLFTLIRVAGNKNSKPTPMSRSEAAARQRELNAKRRAELGSKG